MTRTTKAARRRTLLLAPLLALTRTAHAQATGWPAKPLKVIVAYPTGGPADSAARQIAERLTTSLGQPVVIENRAGASGSIGMDALAKAAPDGHTIGFASISPLSLSPHVGRVPYDPLKDVMPVARVMYSPIYVLATPAFTGTSLADALAQARARPGRLNFATSGVASVGHLMLEALMRQAKVEINHVPYKGGGQIITDAVGGQFDLLTQNPSPTLNAMIAQGKLRVLAVAAPQRLSAMPDKPTLLELGHPAANLTSVFGFFAPARTRPEIVARLNTEINAVLATRDMQERLARIDNVVSPASVEQFVSQIAAEHEANARLVREAGIRAD